MVDGTPQLALAIERDVEARFDTFFAGPNAAAVAALRPPAPPGVWLAGGPGSGRSHLLQAVVADAAPGAAMYLPLAAGVVTPEALHGLPPDMIVCIDDIDCIAGDDAWERALLVLYEQLRAGRGALVAAARDNVRHCHFALADLNSRFAALSAFRLQQPDDAGQLVALKMRAAARGLTLPDDVARYLVRRLPRELPTLFEWLALFDRESLAAGRALTIPFVRDVIARSSRG